MRRDTREKSRGSRVREHRSFKEPLSRDQEQRAKAEQQRIANSNKELTSKRTRAPKKVKQKKTALVKYLSCLHDGADNAKAKGERRTRPEKGCAYPLNEWMSVLGSLDLTWYLFLGLSFFCFRSVWSHGSSTSMSSRSSTPNETAATPQQYGWQKAREDRLRLA
jgi:hypothetical protein